jgi:pimeloyl-ACP methyl ester carboxylesterase
LAERAPACYADVSRLRLFHREIGSGPPVVLLHGGLANSDYLGNQARALARAHCVILVDSRGHGRSTRDQRPFGYDLMADDVVAPLDTLKIDKAAIVGWSDGAIIGLDLAMRHPERVTRVFAFGANTLTSGLKDGFENNPTFAAFLARASRTGPMRNCTRFGHRRTSLHSNLDSRAYALTWAHIRRCQPGRNAVQARPSCW